MSIQINMLKTESIELPIYGKIIVSYDKMGNCLPMKMKAAPDPKLELLRNEPTEETGDDYNQFAGQTEQPGDNPLGELLLAARKKMGWTRAELAARTQISQSSIVRYERAGSGDEIEQYPPADRLAILCWHLKIRPSNIMIASLPPRFRQEGYAAFSDPVGHPMHDFMRSQYHELLHENHLYRTLFARLFGPKPEKNSKQYERLLWLIGSAKELFQKQAAFDNVMSEAGKFVPLVREFHEPHAPEAVIEDWVYKGTPEISLVDGDEIASILGWEKPVYDQKTFEETLEEGCPSHVMRVRDEKMMRKSSEADWSSPPSPETNQTPTACKETKDG